MKKIILTLQFILILNAVSFTQVTIKKGSEMCSEKKMNSKNLSNLFNFDSPNSPAHNFDVLDYKIYLDIRSCFISPFPKSFTGNVIVTFRIDTALNSIALNAVNSSLVVSSVSLAGVSFNHSSNILTIQLDRTYAAGETAQVKINYSHNNVSDNVVYVSNGFFFTDCEPEGARKWFPCYDKPSDKATVDITARVKGGVFLGSNGRLNDSLVTGDTVYYHWISRDPVATYLTVLTAKLNYNLNIVYWHKLSNPADSVPVRFYYNSGENTNSIRPKVLNMMTHFSEKFGEHPFEKNGFATLNSQFQWGGMENQTLTSLCQNCWNENIISHEFAHQWFGDMITCATWADIWLNEGFATYIEAVWYGSQSGDTRYKKLVRNEAVKYIAGNPGWAVYEKSWDVSSPDSDQLFNTSITYSKSSCLIYMLRYVIGEKEFDDIINKYATNPDYMYGNINTLEFINFINEKSGTDLNWFFDQWLYKPGHPVYNNNFSSEETTEGKWKTDYTINQIQTNNVFYKMPVDLKIVFDNGKDTTVTLNNDYNLQIFSFDFDYEPKKIIFDPENKIILKEVK